MSIDQKIIEQVRPVVHAFGDMPNTLRYVSHHNCLMYTAIDPETQQPCQIIDFENRIPEDYETYKVMVMQSFMDMYKMGL